MSKFLFAAAAASTLAIAASAPAQDTRTTAGVNIDARIDRLEQRLRAGLDQRTISSDEARLLAPQLTQLRDLYRRLAADGFTREERQSITAQLREVRRQMRIADAGAWDRYDSDDWWRDDEPGFGYGYGQDSRIDRDNDGWDDRDRDRDGRWEDDVGSGYGYSYGQNDRIDRNNDGYDDRDWDRDGRFDDDLAVRLDRNYDGIDDRDYDRDGRWDDDVAEGRYAASAPPPAAAPAQPQSIVGALLNTFLGGATPTLQPGQQAPDNLYGVPYQYQSQYRDGNGVYFRSDGRAIYEIDARTRSVVRVHPMGQ